MKYWHPGFCSSEERGGRGPERPVGRDRQFPPGWWIVPFFMIGLLLWSVGFVLLSYLLDW
jgi:hypothetical protein